MDVVLSKQSDEPIYLQIYKQISSQIINGLILPQSQLPTIRAVAKELRISVIPVKRAWEELDRNGFINTVVGRGTFVASLEAVEIQEKKDTKNEELINLIVKQAKEINLSKEELIKLINERY